MCVQVGHRRCHVELKDLLSASGLRYGAVVTVEG